jgi:two-component system LytT family response regulator
MQMMLAAQLPLDRFPLPVAAARPLRVLVVEDEPLARQRLERLVSADPGRELVAVCGDGHGAIETIDRGGIDVALLDVSLPGPDGLSIGAHAAARGVLCIFTTASLERAAEAFAINAVDFLVKPFARERLETAMARAAERLASQQALSLAQRMRDLLVQPVAPPHPRQESVSVTGDLAPGRGRFLVRHDGRMSLVREAQIEWIEADAKYTLLHLGHKVLRAAEGFSAVLANTTPGLFLQVNRSAAINTDRIREVQELFKGNVGIVMNGGTEIAVSRRCRARVLATLGAKV